ncbi:MAG: zinc-dependent metalloprotease [Niabella sp.]
MRGFTIILCGLILLGSVQSYAQNDTIRTPKPVIAKADTSKPAMPSAKPGARPGLKPYQEIIPDSAVTDDGIIKVHKVDDRYFFELEEKSYDKDFLVVVRLTKAGAEMRSGMSGYAGDQIGQSVIRFEKGPNNKVFIRSVSFADYSKDSTMPMFRALERNNVQPIIFSFDAKSKSKDGKGFVIDVTDFVNGDNEIVSFFPNYKNSFRVGGQQVDKSYINSIKSYPTNVEINTVKTFSKSAGMPMGVSTAATAMRAAPTGNYTVEINSSIVLLPENKMQPRYFDPRVGYFAVGYYDFDKNPQAVDRSILIKRWRLEPKPQDLAKYKRGELVEPAKPIVFYIDPATPKKWVPYLIAGVNDWQKAFEKAGFKNAIYAREAPSAKENPEWSIADARYSVIVYKPSDVPNASGPSIADPRTGEIMESHVNWYHNIMVLLNNWYMIQAGPNDAGARKIEFDDKLMGELIRFVSSHEVGHTLGLRHNFISSATVPVEKLRDKKFLKENGHTPSIMDYARFNYVAQPEDNIPRELLMPKIGDYDEWAIEWGYKRLYDYNSPDVEKAYLNKWVMEKIKNPRLWFGTEMSDDDPRLQSEQVGDNAMVANTYGIKNLQRVVPNLIQWTNQPNEGYNALSEKYNEVKTQFGRYLMHVTKYIGGIYETPKMREEKGSVYEVVEPGLQKEALAFLDKNIFNVPAWLIPTDILDKTGESPISVVNGLQSRVLGRILSARTLDKLLQAESTNPSKAYPALQYLGDVKQLVFTDLLNGNKTDVYRRSLQGNYVNTLINIIAEPPANAANMSVVILMGGSRNAFSDDTKAIVRGHLIDLAKQLEAAQGKASDDMTRYHIQDLTYRINKAVKIKD